MVRAAIRAHHRCMPMNTSRVTAGRSAQQASRPVTGYDYLDAVRPGSVLAMAHRGGALHPDLTGAENTMHAFRHAVDLGYRYLETDVHATSDGVLLAFHDAALDRVTDHVGLVADHTAEQVALARIAEVHAVPTMAELLAAFPDCRFNIDLKSATAVSPLVELLEQSGAHDRVCVGSFSGRRLNAFRRATAGRVATSATPAEVAAMRFSPIHGRRRAAVMQVPWRHKRRRVTIASPAFVRRAHRAGMQVHVWTGEENSQWVSIDDTESMHMLLDMGVDGLITDRTDVLKDVLVRRGQWTADAT